MRKSSTMVFCLFIIICTSICYAADKEAITTDGIKVILKDNGTWIEQKKTENQKQDKTQNEFDFRNTKWGMSKEQVKKTESSEIIEEDTDSIIYNDIVSHMPVMVIYIFVDDKLVRSKYIFNVDHTNKNDYINDYEKLQELLVSIYGNKFKKQILWINDLYKDYYDQWGFAVSMGHLAYSSQWVNQASKILLFLSGDNFQISLVIEYQSKLLEKLDEEFAKKKAKKGL
jgi:hypothetical protein